MKNLKYVLAGFIFVMGVYFLFNTFIKEEAMPKVKLTTSYGDIVLELDQENAPISSENFLSYVESGFYKETILRIQNHLI